MNGDDYDYYDDEDQDVETFDFSMENFWLHDSFECGLKYFDIAIIKLDSRVTLGENINTICLTGVSSNPIYNGASNYMC